MANLNNVAEALRAAIDDMVEQALAEVDFTEKVTEAVDFEDLAEAAVDSAADNIDLEAKVCESVNFDRLATDAIQEAVDELDLEQRFVQAIDYVKVAEKIVANDLFHETVLCDIRAEIASLELRAVRAEENARQAREDCEHFQRVVENLSRPRPTLTQSILRLVGLA